MKKISNRVSTMIQARQRSAPNPSTKCGQRAKRAAIGADIRNRKNGLHLSVTACPPRAAIHYCRVAKNDVIPQIRTLLALVSVVLARRIFKCLVGDWQQQTSSKVNCVVKTSGESPGRRGALGPTRCCGLSNKAWKSCFFSRRRRSALAVSLQHRVVRRRAWSFGDNEDRWQGCCFLIDWVVPQSASTTVDHQVGASTSLSSRRRRQNENIFFDRGSSSLFIAGGNGGRRNSRRTMWVVSTSFDGRLAG